MLLPQTFASLIREAWPQSVTPVNIMSGFKKSGVYPLNPGAVSDHQIVVNPGTTSLQRSKSDSMLTQDPSAEDEDRSASIPVFTCEEGILVIRLGMKRDVVYMMQVILHGYEYIILRVPAVLAPTHLRVLWYLKCQATMYTPRQESLLPLL